MVILSSSTAFFHQNTSNLSGCSSAQEMGTDLFILCQYCYISLFTTKEPSLKKNKSPKAEVIAYKACFQSTEHSEANSTARTISWLLPKVVFVWVIWYQDENLIRAWNLISNQTSLQQSSPKAEDFPVAASTPPQDRAVALAGWAVIFTGICRGGKSLRATDSASLIWLADQARGGGLVLYNSTQEQEVYYMTNFHWEETTNQPESLSTDQKSWTAQEWAHPIAQNHHRRLYRDPNISPTPDSFFIPWSIELFIAGKKYLIFSSCWRQPVNASLPG